MGRGMLPRVNIGDAVPAGRGTRLHVSVECLHAADCILLWPEATHLYSDTAETMRVQPRMTRTEHPAGRSASACLWKRDSYATRSYQPQLTSQC